MRNWKCNGSNTTHGRNNKGSSTRFGLELGLSVNLAVESLERKRRRSLGNFNKIYAVSCITTINMRRVIKTVSRLRQSFLGQWSIVVKKIMNACEDHLTDRSQELADMVNVLRFKFSGTTVTWFYRLVV